ncbi:MAG TPA: hypothetical protein VNJ08_15055 [Bacteriovoracaceae bacterium]|nr:hypothetical protein [Bacteriovoracaceae bacterium]
MTYYFIGPEPSPLEKIQSRIAFLSGGVWVINRDKLSQILAQPPSAPVFFLHQKEKKFQEWAIAIRETWIDAKLIYVSEGIEPHELKEHQMSPSGGDAYIHESVDEDMLADIIRSLSSAVPKPPKKLASLPEAPPETEEIFKDLSALEKVLQHPLSKTMDEIFISVLQLNSKRSGGLENPDLYIAPPKPPKQPAAPTGDSMEKDKELALDDLGELELGSFDEAPALPDDDGLSLSLDLGVALELGGSDVPSGAPADSGFDLSADGPSLELGSTDAGDSAGDSFGDLTLSDSDEGGDDFTLSLSDDDNSIDLSFDEVPLPPVPAASAVADEGLDFTGGLELGEDDDSNALALSDDNDMSIDLGSELSLGEDSDSISLDDSDEGLSLDFGADIGSDNSATSTVTGGLSDDAKKKMMEIDELMDLDASQLNITIPQSDGNDGLDLMVGGDEELNLDFSSGGSFSDEPLVSDDMNLDSFNSSLEPEEVPTPVITKAPKPVVPVMEEEEVEEEEEIVEVKPKKKKKEEQSSSKEADRAMSEDFKEISGAYSGEMERTQATIANLRADRGELLAKIQQLEEDKVLHNRQSLTSRAELDERKIELTIIRKKLNEEINELKDRMRMQDERKLILEEKNRILMQELDKAGQKNKIDIKKVQMRERDLEQKLELLKSDAETQIRNRDLKILELKRKIDAMEFDMESISSQEKRSVENRYELEDKLDKAIKTLRSAISVLEDETDRGSALEALKKNIDV